MNGVQVRGERLKFASTLLFETPGGLRFTQDSPILPNVWYAFAAEPRSQQELILTVTQEASTGAAASQLRNMLNELRIKRPTVGAREPIERQRARVCYIPGQIAVKLYFDEMMRVVLPLTPWWHETYDCLRKIEEDYKKKDGVNPADWRPFPQPDETGRREKDLVDALMLMRREIDPSADAPIFVSGSEAPTEDRIRYVREIPPDLSWLVRIAGLIGDCFSNGTQLLEGGQSLSAIVNRDFGAREHDRIETAEERAARLDERVARKVEAREARRGIVEAFVGLYDKWCVSEQYPDQRLIWRVTKNRRVHLAVAKSALTVKADAARRLFDISCQDITWAILDSGIDAAHPAFKLTTEAHEAQVKRRKRAEAGDNPTDEDLEIAVSDLESRVVKTLDFTRLRELLDYDIEIEAKSQAAIDRVDRMREEIARRMVTPGADRAPSSEEMEAAGKLVQELQSRIEAGKEINWQDLEPAIVVEAPDVPTNDHGTHVAGILGADWIADEESERNLPLALRTRRMQGVCPDIKLIDVRVFREDGLTDEFELLAAIQFLRWMNTRAGTMQVHGANISLSLIHEVRRFACGQTPICDECNEASALGMVIVAAAGNRGFEISDPDTIRASDSYKSVSITDPGNAANVITVGATHRKRPHEYGISYFSSRGPTGDGRLKPDLVAPGEKIKGPTPNERAEFKDGTSMAAPHVSGVAAMLMARYSELIGQPERIKSILCATATDLGRERYFQGAGLVDALRALQSV